MPEPPTPQKPAADEPHYVIRDDTVSRRLRTRQAFWSLPPALRDWVYRFCCEIEHRELTKEEHEQLAQALQNHADRLAAKIGKS
jgi:hypothetical protein